MGYYVDTAEREITIKEDQFDNCYKAMCKLNDNDDAKRGGGWNNIGITSDNPRTENPSTIITEMEAGVEPQNFKKSLSIEDRKQAIKTACQLANANDIILIAGKGHETYQEIQGVRHDFDDMKMVKEFLQQMNK